MKIKTLTFSHKNKKYSIHSWQLGDCTSPAILLLHGFPTSSNDYLPLANRLKEKYCLISFDFLGFGQSQKSQLPSLSIHLQADIAQFVASSYELINPYLIAHDYGLTVAQELLSRQQLFKKILLLNGGVYSHLHRPLLIQRLLQTPVIGAVVAKFNTRRLFIKNMSRILSAKVPEHYLQEAWQDISLSGGQYQFHKLIHYMADRRQYAQRWSQALQMVQAKLAFFWGEKDPISGAHMLAALQQNLPAATFISAPIGHYPQWEAIEQLEEFIVKIF